MIRIGVIGYGYWGPNLARNISELDEAELTVVCDARAELGALVEKRHPGARFAINHDEIISDGIVDAVVVATPVQTHFEIAMGALKAGKHVLVSKPIAASADEARNLIDEANRRNLTLLVDHTFVYTESVRKIREIVASGQLGTINYYDSMRVNLGLFRHDVSVLWDLAVHDLAILDFVIDERPVAVSACGAGHVPGSPENTAFLTLFFDSGFIAHVNVNWLAPVKVRHTLIGGDRKMIVYNDLEPSEKVKVYDSGVDVTLDREDIYQMLFSYRAGDMWAPKIASKEALNTEIAHFVSCIQGHARPVTSGNAGMRVVDILEKASLSMARRGQPVDL